MKRRILALILMVLAVELALTVPVLALTPFGTRLLQGYRSLTFTISHAYSHGERHTSTRERTGCLLTRRRYGACPG